MYAAAKGGIEDFTRTLAAEAIPHRAKNQRQSWTNPRLPLIFSPFQLSLIPILLAELGGAYVHRFAEHAAEVEAVFVAAISGNDVKRPIRGQEQSARMLDPVRR